MLIIVGFLVVIISVLGGYLGAHGRLGALWQPYELVIIGGAALGAFLVGTPAKTVKQTLQAMVGVFKGPRYKQQDYIDVLSLSTNCSTRPAVKASWRWKTMASARPKARCSATIRRCRPTTT
jgi:flagellar motor component MotA